jgi:hypothetical protein
MRQSTAVIRLTEEETKTLEEWTRRGKNEHRRVERARIILLANAGRTNQQIAGVLGTGFLNGANVLERSDWKG